jgi:hypothetical protein
MLKPCPFCGSRAETYEIIDDKAWRVGCTNEECIGNSVTYDYGGYDTERKAVEAWNTRANEKVTIVEYLDECHTWAFFNATRKKPQAAINEYLRLTYEVEDIPFVGYQTDQGGLLWWYSTEGDARAFEMDLEP